jgi:ketosteroid isomerase-like protein
MPTDITTPNVNIENTKRIYAAVPIGDAETVFRFLDPEIVIRYYGVDDIPYSGVFEGLEGATDFFTRVGQHVEVVSMEPYYFISEGDELAVWGHLEFRRTATGEEFSSDFAHIITLRDGKWLHFRDFMNSAVAADAFRNPSGVR